MKRAWLWIVAAATAVAAAVAGIVLLVLTGQRKTPVLPPPERPDTPPVDKPLVTLRPIDDYETTKAVPVAAPDAVITRINARHSDNGDKP
jgi:hypothetical protein